MLKVLSIFSGIGAYERALKNLNIPFELVNYAEIDNKTAEAYSYIHNVPTDLNLGDITKVDGKNITDIDMVVYSPPCQSFSISGKQLGFEDTRGILFFDAFRIINEKRPKYCIMENVKNLAGKKFKNEFNAMRTSLEEAGYNNYTMILNSKDFGVPQNRERVFLVSIRKDIDKGYIAPTGYTSNIKLEDLLEEIVDEKYFLNNYNLELLKEIDFNFIDITNNRIIKYVIPQIVTVRKEQVDIESLKIVLRNHKNLTNKEIASRLNKPITLIEHWFRRDSSFSIPDADIWFELKSLLGIETNEFDYSITTFIQKEGSYDKTNRVYDTRGIAPTLTKVNAAERIIINNRIRSLTPLETFRLMGFKDEDYFSIKDLFTDSQIYGMAGNSVVVNVLEAIIKNIFI